MPRTFFLIHPIPQTRKIGGERKLSTLDRFECRDLFEGEAPPSDDMISAVMKCTRTESGGVPDEAVLRKLDLEGGVSSAVQRIFNI